jgi:hypothetical protein
MPSSRPILVESPSLFQVLARSLSLIDPLRRNTLRAIVIPELSQTRIRLRHHSRYASPALFDTLIREKPIQYP